MKRPKGLFVLFAVVAVGMGASSVFWHWQAPRYMPDVKLAKERPQDMTFEERLDAWLYYSRGMIHSRLLQLRLDAERPWLVTHVVEPSDDPATHEAWGVDLGGLGPEISRRDGSVVAVELPDVQRLGRGPVTGDKVVHVPRCAPGAVPIDPTRRAEEVVEWSVEKLARGLAKDIPGASLEARVGRATAGGGAP